MLKSWAVPKGPCLDPSQRRLAVHVEDHPMEYGSFEGEIPKGQYGGGTVLLWDLGRWIPAGDPVEGYRQGRLKFRLDGRKLKGAWMLVRMTGPRSEGGKNWLLIKERDQAARALERGDVLEERPESVAPKRGGPARVWRSDRAEPAPPRERVSLIARPDAPSLLPGAEPAACLERLEPELATLVAAVPRGGEWVHELKFDGYRVIARCCGGRPRLFTRRWNDWTADFPEVERALRGLAAREAVLDGEIVVLDQEGRSSFQALQNALSGEGRERMVYQVFDLLHLDGYDLRGVPLIKRKEALRALLEQSAAAAPAEFGARVRYSEHLDGRGERLFRRACELALEGVVSKRRDAPYREGRGADWVKAKCLQEQEFVIAGWTEPSGARRGFGALLLGVNEGGKLGYVGRVGTGFDTRQLRELHARLLRLESAKPAFANPPAGAAARGVHWARPKLVAQVAFSGWTRDGALRQPSFRGLREDKGPEEIAIERPKPLPRRGNPEPARERFAGVRLSSPDKVLYPEQGLTKRDLAAYYESVAGLLLPHAARRPLALLRCPSGRSKPCFFQKHADRSFPEAIKPVEVREKDGTVEEYFYIEDAKGLLSLVQLGVLELHPWGSLVDELERPERAIFDLDPGPGVGWSRVIEAAREIRERLAALKLESFVKTTGGKGLHVVVPLEPLQEWPEVKAFAKAFAELMALDDPKRYTARLSKAERGGRIFVDYLRNERGSTAVAPYSTRARPGAPVSVPLDWEELSPTLKSDHFNARNLAKRLASRADPWRGFEAGRRALPRA